MMKIFFRNNFDKIHRHDIILEIQVCSHLLYASAPLCTKAFVLSRALLDHKLECTSSAKIPQTNDENIL